MLCSATDKILPEFKWSASFKSVDCSNLFFFKWILARLNNYHAFSEFEFRNSFK